MRRHLLLGLILLLGGCGGSGSGPADALRQPNSGAEEGVSARGAGPQPAPILYRTGTGRWYVADSVGASGPLSDAQFTYGGDATDLPVTGDFDGDGRRDVGVYRRATGRWYLLTAWASGSSVADMKVDFGGHPSDVPFVGDWDGDGRDDLGLYRSATGEWRLPSGNFRIPAEADALPLVGDFDGDGRTDVGLFTPDTGRWRLDVTRDGVADRTFVYGGQPSDFPLSADFDGDGDDDPALYRRDTGQWFLLTGLDGSTITGDVQLRYGGHASDIPVLGDYNGDGSADPGVYRREGGAWFLLTGRSGNQTLSDYQFVYGGDGSDLPVTSAAFYDLLPGGHRLALALDIDPVKPVLAAGSGTAVTAWATYAFAQRAPVAAAWTSSNEGVAHVAGNQLQAVSQGTAVITAIAGSVQASTEVTAVAIPAGTAGFRVGVTMPDGATANAILDADLDLFPDLVGMAGGSTPWWRHNNGDRTFGDKNALPAGNRSDFFEVRAGDVNGDGLQDVLARNHSDVATWLHLAGGGFAAPVTATSATDFVSHWVILDVNGDGRQDLLTNSGPNLAVRLSRGDGTWNTALVRSLPDGAGQFAVGDLDGDGRLDVAVAGSTAVSVCRGNGDGTFGAPASYAMTPAPLGVAVGDFDGDGRADVAASAQGAAEVRFFPGQGDGTLGSSRTLAVGAVPTGLRAVGTTLVVECKDADFVELWSAGPTLRKRMGATFYRSPEWAQMDGAGPLDLLSTDVGGSFLVFDEEAPEVTSLGAGGGPDGGSIAVGDLDRDGTPDVVASVVGQSKVSVLVGGTQVDYFVPDSAFVVRLVDVDGDGLLDLLAWVGSRLVLLRGHGDGTPSPRLPSWPRPRTRSARRWRWPISTATVTWTSWWAVAGRCRPCSATGTATSASRGPCRCSCRACAASTQAPWPWRTSTPMGGWTWRSERSGGTTST